MNGLPWLTILILVPLFGGIVVAGLGAEQRRLVRGLALFFSLVGLTGALCLWKHFDAASGNLQFVEKLDWVKSLGIQLSVYESMLVQAEEEATG